MNENQNKNNDVDKPDGAIPDLDKEPAFHTPEEVAAEPTEGEDSTEAPTNADPPAKADSSSWKEKLKNFARFEWPPSRRQVIISAVILGAAIGALAYFLTRPQPTVIYEVKSPPHLPKSDKVPSNLTGVLVDPQYNKLPVTGVMIENSLPARPQSGLGDAGVVFEAIAEGGITRFLALYQESQPSNLGPVRSARPYYVEWDLGFDASYAHVGGSPEALSDIKAWGVKDMNQFYNGGYYHRISNRYAPHNAYTAISQLHQLEKASNFGASHFTGFPRKKEQPGKTPAASSIDLTFSYSDYGVHYKYSPNDNAYLRWEGGQPHIDANTNKQIEPKVVVAIVVPYSLESDGYHSDYNVIGTGAAYVFQDGNVEKGAWQKTSRTDQIKLTDTNGQPLKINAGNTWIEAMKSPGNVSYSP